MIRSARARARGESSLYLNLVVAWGTLASPGGGGGYRTGSIWGEKFVSSIWAPDGGRLGCSGASIGVDWGAQLRGLYGGRLGCSGASMGVDWGAVGRLWGLIGVLRSPYWGLLG